jgi:hypothetical protein
MALDHARKMKRLLLLFVPESNTFFMIVQQKVLKAAEVFATPGHDQSPISARFDGNHAAGPSHALAKAGFQVVRIKPRPSELVCRARSNNRWIRG